MLLPPLLDMLLPRVRTCEAPSIPSRVRSVEDLLGTSGVRVPLLIPPVLSQLRRRLQFPLFDFAP